MDRDEAYRAAELASRTAYGRLVAYLARRSDLASAEDALGDALAAALTRWPRDGVPARPEAWLLTAARRRLVDASRRDAAFERSASRLLASAERAVDAADAIERLPDERLELLFACAHPAIDAAARTPLVLRSVLGVDAGRIAAAYLTSPAAMRQRLVRAQRKIRDAGIAFAVPERDALAERSAVVLEAVYAAFGLSWEAPGADGGGDDLNRETLWLAGALAELLPENPEAHGLLALVCYVEARRPARRDVRGAYVPLDAQDPARWSPELADRADAALARAASAAPGRFALEAAIQRAHCARRHGSAVDWAAIAALYDVLVTRTSALGAAVSRAAARARASGDAVGLAVLAAIDPARVATYQPYWAVRAHLTGDRADYERAIGLAEDAATREFLVERRDARAHVSQRR